MPLDESFFCFEAPVFPFTEKLLMDVIQHTYTAEAVHTQAQEFLQYAVKLHNYIQPGLLKTLEQQRKEYCQESTPDFPILQEAASIDDVPVHNYGMENFRGKHASLMEKLKTVEAASRSKVLKGTQKLADQANHFTPINLR